MTQRYHGETNVVGNIDANIDSKKKNNNRKTACCPEFKKRMHLYYDKSYPFISISKLISREKEAFIKHIW